MIAVESCRTQLREIARELRASVGQGLSPDQHAYAALLQDGELHPWTEQARVIWTQAPGSDPWRHHHLAVLHHAMAYDLEMAGSSEAFDCWASALRHWAAVHADDEFWVRMTGHLSEHMALEVGPNVVAGVRARLPRDLLEPHRHLIASYRWTDPERARSHMRVVKSAPFDSEIIDGLRIGLVREVAKAVPGAVGIADFEAIIADLRQWLHIDEDNAHLVHAFLYAYRKFNEHVHRADDGLDRVARNMAEVDQVIRPILEAIRAPLGSDPTDVARYVERLEALRPREGPQDALLAEMARCEFWSGWVSVFLARISDGEHGAAKAVTHFARARLMYTQLQSDHYYAEAMDRLQARAESMWGSSLLSPSRPGGPDPVGAAQHFREALALNSSKEPIAPGSSNVASLLGLARAVLMPDDVSGDELIEAEQLLSQAAAEGAESDEENDRALRELRGRLAIKRARAVQQPDAWRRRTGG